VFKKNKKSNFILRSPSFILPLSFGEGPGVRSFYYTLVCYLELSGEIFNLLRIMIVVKPHPSSHLVKTSPLNPLSEGEGAVFKIKNSSFIFTPLLRRGARGEVFLFSNEFWRVVTLSFSKSLRWLSHRS
jgi:hypothetical protein